VRLLLDSQVVIWSLQEPERLSPEAGTAIRKPANDVLVSVASIWELSIKQSIGKLTVAGDLREHIALQSFAELPVLGEHAVAVRDLPMHHRDPFDRMLITQARCEGLTIVTSDSAFAAYEVPLLGARS
jgi:PIN domain nuclease of toxin-antitoxin system